ELEVLGALLVTRVVDLRRDEEHGLAELPQPLGDLLVAGREALAPVDGEQDQVDVPDGGLDPLLDRPLPAVAGPQAAGVEDRKSTRLNSSHVKISYAV